nr:hypothetical protein [Nocardia miyunensis]
MPNRHQQSNSSSRLADHELELSSNPNAGTKFGEKPPEMRVGLRDPVRIDVPPRSTIEFPWVQGILALPRPANDVPERDVGMRKALPDSLCHGQEQRTVTHDGELGIDTEFLGRLAPGRDERILPGLHMPAHRQVQSGEPVPPEEQGTFLGIDEHDVGNQMLRRDSRFDPAENIVGTGEPRASAVDVLPLEGIERRDRFHDLSDERGGRLHDE